MGNEITKYRGRSFVANDAYLRVAMLLAAIRVKATGESALTSIADDWLAQSTHCFGFGPVFGFDEVIQSASIHRTVLGAMRSALLSIQNRTSEFSIEELTTWSVGGSDVTYDKPISRHEVENALERLVTLLVEGGFDES